MRSTFCECCAEASDTQTIAVSKRAKCSGVTSGVSSGGGGVGSSLGGGTVVTPATGSIISNLPEVNKTTGVSDNGVVVVIAPPGKTMGHAGAIITGSSSAYADIRKNAKFKFGVATLPYPKHYPLTSVDEVFNG